MSNARRIADIFGGTAPTANTLRLGDSSQSRLFIPGVGIDTNTLSNNQTLQWNNTAGAFSNVSLGSSVTVYDSASLFPLTGNAAGDQAYASDTNRLFLFSGSGWYRIATINATPTLTTSPNAAYDLDSNGGTATTISLTATDSDGTPIFWSYTADDSADDLATITNDSNGTFTITAKTLSDILAAGYDSNGGSFDITFKASDNINFASATSEFTITYNVNSLSAFTTWAQSVADVTDPSYTNNPLSIWSQESFTDGDYHWVYYTSCPSATGTMWGSPYAGLGFFTHDSQISRVLQHAVDSQTTHNTLISNGDPILLRLTRGSGSSTYTSLTRNGYTSQSYTTYQLALATHCVWYNSSTYQASWSYLSGSTGSIQHGATDVADLYTSVPQ